VSTTAEAKGAQVTEEVLTMRLDRYCAAEGIAHVHVAKIAWRAPRCWCREA